MIRNERVLILCAIVVVVGSLAGGLGYLAVSVDSTPADAGDEPANWTDQPIESVHEAGVTGENVSVGVLDVTGFDAEHRLLEERVVDIQGFGDGSSLSDEQHSHGTATAVTVAQTAPDADLYLGTFETPDDYEAGLEWLLEEDVDVVVTPVADAGTLGDGSDRLSQATTEATERGLVVVASAGNLGEGHWAGEYQPDENGVHVFDNGPLNEVSGPAGSAAFHLVWDDPDESFGLELHRLGEDGTTDVVAQSLPDEHGEAPSERLTARLSDDSYALVVRGPEGGGDDPDTEPRLRVTSASHTLADDRPAGSVAAPGAAPGAITVGAYDPTADELESFSSRGPTADGRLGVYVVAPSVQYAPGEPRFEGTSAAAAYVGGIAALVVDTNPELAPDEVRWILASSADPIDGIDAESGHGMVAPDEAVSAAGAESESAE